MLFTAASSPDGRASALFPLAGPVHCELLSSRHAIDEAQRTIARKAPARTQALNAVLQIVHRVPEADPRLRHRAAALDLPPGDEPIRAGRSRLSCEPARHWRQETLRTRRRTATRPRTGRDPRRSARSGARHRPPAGGGPNETLMIESSEWLPRPQSFTPRSDVEPFSGTRETPPPTPTLRRPLNRSRPRSHRSPVISTERP